MNGKDVSSDVILISDNGLYGIDTTAVPDNTVQYYYNYTIPYFLASRVAANSDSNRVYSLLQLPKYQNKQKSKYNYGIVIKGIQDINKETVPVRLTTDINYEAPAIGSDSDFRPGPNKVLLTINVSGLKKGQVYNLYYYTNEKQVPVKDFNQQSKKRGIKPWKRIEATDDSWKTDVTIMSDQKAFFRAVKADGN